MSRFQQYVAACMLSLAMTAIMAPFIALIVWSHNTTPTPPQDFHISPIKRSILIPILFVPIVLSSYIVGRSQKSRYGKYFRSNMQTMTPLIGTSLILGTISFGILLVVFMFLGELPSSTLTGICLLAGLYFYILGNAGHSMTGED